ncbi:MAG: hypothetical protein SGJ20_05025 [Planctomycetota bacterium]|nr:hypothetical protein [Planctomycetota bacterium]
MNTRIKQQRIEVRSEANERSTSGNEGTVHRTRVAQLLGKLLFKRWQSEKQLNNEYKTKP